ncbi:hypothetical protein DSO57_1033387 [Entomophthora muscae]|uniref:Uncharacterized protein n=1 Tax=Entomophthora muscae TaxID=34485 RepID=A0ACC2UAA7_9FUNG|nr:hypothetical protein DSO57_1033387 [Entomophthora muscae]
MSIRRTQLRELEDTQAQTLHVSIIQSLLAIAPGETREMRKARLMSILFQALERSTPKAMTSQARQIEVRL